MLRELKRVRYLSQDTVGWEISNRFGARFIYVNDLGNVAVRKDVLAEFEKLTGDNVVWERSAKLWRFREFYDLPGRQQP